MQEAAGSQKYPLQSKSVNNGILNFQAVLFGLPFSVNLNFIIIIILTIVVNRCSSSNITTSPSSLSFPNMISS